MIIGIIPSDIKFYTVKTLKLNLFFKKYTFYIFTVHFKDGKKFTFLMKNKARVDNLYEQFGSEVDSAIVNDDNEQSAYSDETTRESVELLISELQTYLRQNAQATKQKKE